jgi:ribosomal protein L29
MRSLKVVLIGLMVVSVGLLAYADGQPKQPSKPATAARGSLFVDVPSDHYAASDLKFLVERGIITGLPNGEFQGGKALTRYDAAVLIARALRYLQNDPEKIQPADLKVLQDLIFKVSERVQALDALEQDVATLKSRPTSDSSAEVLALKEKLSQNEVQIAGLQTQVQSLKAELQQARAASSGGVVPEEVEQLRRQVANSLLIAGFAALAGVVAVIWAIVT